ncbi:MAG: hypothetical protein VX589_02700 [Myxococcota bacterium]|nr:hypothetical protein [Myxococcota bacterium]
MLVAVVGLIAFAEMNHRWNMKRDDLGLLVVGVVAALFIFV